MKLRAEREETEGPKRWREENPNLPKKKIGERQRPTEGRAPLQPGREKKKLLRRDCKTGKGQRVC